MYVPTAERRIVIILRLTVVILLCFLALFVLVGCEGKVNDGYRRFTLRYGIASFSFEYPAYYQKPSIDRTGLPYSVSVDSLYLTQKGQEYSALSHIGITIMDSKYFSQYYSTNASALLEKDLRDFEGGAVFHEFRLLERSRVKVAGIDGEQMIFSHTGIPDLYHGQKGEPYAMRGSKVYFYSNGGFWTLSLDYPLSTAEIAEADFEHLLQTFKILD